VSSVLRRDKPPDVGILGVLAGSSVGDVIAVFSHGGHERVDGRLGVQPGSCEGGPDDGAECGEAGFVLLDVNDGEAVVRLVADVVEAVRLRVDGGAAEFEDFVVFGVVFAGEVEDDDNGHGASLLGGRVEGSKAG
jgi:hypothetical protein